MSRLGPAAAGSALFFLVAPVTVAGVVPWWITRGQPGPAPVAVRAAGLVVLVTGAALVAECFWRFATRGRGTPAPVLPTETLVVSGAYRYVRNPMYVGVVAAIAGQALLLARLELLTYAVAVWALFHAFVVIYEEPVLQQRHAQQYAAYRRAVGRWVPRLRPWSG